jgi:hypothetical protein
MAYVSILLMWRHAFVVNRGSPTMAIVRRCVVQSAQRLTPHHTTLARPSSTRHGRLAFSYNDGNTLSRRLIGAMT